MYLFTLHYLSCEFVQCACLPHFPYMYCAFAQAICLPHFPCAATCYHVTVSFTVAVFVAREAASAAIAANAR